MILNLYNFQGYWLRHHMHPYAASIELKGCMATSKQSQESHFDRKVNLKQACDQRSSPDKTRSQIGCKQMSIKGAVVLDQFQSNKWTINYTNTQLQSLNIVQTTHLLKPSLAFCPTVFVPDPLAVATTQPFYLRATGGKPSGCRLENPTWQPTDGSFKSSTSTGEVLHVAVWTHKLYGS